VNAQEVRKVSKRTNVQLRDRRAIRHSPARPHLRFFAKRNAFPSQADHHRRSEVASHPMAGVGAELPPMSSTPDFDRRRSCSV
jgi:hypothetical protein